MKTIAKKNFAPLLVAVTLGVSAAVARAEKADEKSKPAEGHTAKIIHNLGARVDKVKAKLKYHADKTADRTEQAASRLSERVNAAGKKLNDRAHQTADKVGAKLEKLTE